MQSKVINFIFLWCQKTSWNETSTSGSSSRSFGAGRWTKLCKACSRQTNRKPYICWCRSLLLGNPSWGWKPPIVLYNVYVVTERWAWGAAAVNAALRMGAPCTGMINIDPSYPWFPGQCWDKICQVWAVFQLGSRPPCFTLQWSRSIGLKSRPLHWPFVLFNRPDLAKNVHIKTPTWIFNCCPNTITNVGTGVRLGLCCFKANYTSAPDRLCRSLPKMVPFIKWTLCRNVTLWPPSCLH